MWLFAIGGGGEGREVTHPQVFHWNCAPKLKLYFSNTIRIRLTGVWRNREQRLGISSGDFVRDSRVRLVGIFGIQLYDRSVGRRVFFDSRIVHRSFGQRHVVVDVIHFHINLYYTNNKSTNCMITLVLHVYVKNRIMIWWGESMIIPIFAAL